MNAMKPPQARNRFIKWAFILVFLASVAGGIQAIRLEHAWSIKGPLEARGGRYFFRRVELPVPSFRQGDDRWRDDLLGPTQNTLGAEGCAVASAAMVLSSYGIDTDPQRLNEFLKGNGGYTPQGWIYWEKAAELSNGHVQKAYEDLPSYSLIDSNLDRRNPVIVRLRLRVSEIGHVTSALAQHPGQMLLQGKAAMVRGDSDPLRLHRFPGAGVDHRSGALFRASDFPLPTEATPPRGSS